MDLQTRFELQFSAQQWVDSIMSQFNISAADMEEALTKVLLTLRQKVLQDYLIEQQKAYQQARNMPSQNETSQSFDSIQEKEESSDNEILN